MQGTALTMRFLELCRQIVNFPIINDNKAFGLLKKFRKEIMMNLNNKGFGLGGAGLNGAGG